MEPPQKKVVVESKIKGPKRLGQGVRGIGVGKKKHHQTADSDDVEEQSGILIDGSVVPTDVQSVSLFERIFSGRKKLAAILFMKDVGKG
jgi:hypothetical protein